MTLATACTPRVPIIGNGTRGPYSVVDANSVAIRLVSTSHLKLTRYDASTDDNDDGTVLVENTDYTVGGTQDARTFTLAAVQAVLTSSQRILAERVQAYTQDLDLTTGGGFNAEAVESRIDKIAEFQQELKARLDRVPQLQYADATANVAFPSPPTSATKILARTTAGAIAHVDLADLGADLALGSGWSSPLATALGSGWSTLFALPSAGVLDNFLGIRFVATYAALTALTTATGLSDNSVYCTYGRTGEEDGAFGFWRYDSGSSATANGGTILALDGGGAGRFFRLYNKVLHPRWFGCAADGTTDDATPFQSCLNACSAGETVDGEGLRYEIGTTLKAWKSLSFPDDVTLCKAQFLATVATNLDVLQVYGSGTALSALSASTAAIVTITNASPAVVTWTAHGLAAGTPVKFSNSGGALPTGLTEGTTYFVLSTGIATDTFRVSATPEGVAINTSSAGSGTHTGTRGILAKSTTITATGAVSGDAGKFIFIQSTDKSCPNKADTFLTGELVRIRSVSGTTITLEHGLRNHYLNSITATLITPIKGFRLEDVSFEGDDTISQGGVHFYRAYECYAETRSEDIGYSAIHFDQSASCTFNAKGSNPGITSDNGLDYIVVVGQGCDIIEGTVVCRHVRHGFASGGTLGMDFGLKITVIASDMKDAACDAHPNVLGIDAEVTVTGPRTGGSLSTSPIGFTWQGGGFCRARINSDGADDYDVLIQPTNHTLNDIIDLDVMSYNAGTAASRTVEMDLNKAGGTIKSISVHAHCPTLAAALSRNISIDTNNCVAGVSIKVVEIDGVFEAASYGALLLVRTGHTCKYARIKGFARQTASGNRGFSAQGFITDVHFEGCETEGESGAIGIEADSDVGHARATSCRATDVGGAGLTTNAERGIDASINGTYT
jgi:hypothetical protein